MAGNMTVRVDARDNIGKCSDCQYANAIEFANGTKTVLCGSTGKYLSGRVEHCSMYVRSARSIPNFLDFHEAWIWDQNWETGEMEFVPPEHKRKRKRPGFKVPKVVEALVVGEGRIPPTEVNSAGGAEEEDVAPKTNL